MNLMKKLVSLGAGIIMLVVGAQHLFAPQMMMNNAGIELSTVNHLHVIRAAYGGAYLGIAVLFLLGAVNVRFSQFSLIAVGVLFSGFALGRIFSIAVDGVPVSLYVNVLIVEIVFAALAIFALKNPRPSNA